MRKDWFKERLIFLSEVFAIDVGGYAIMDTHAHLILRTRPDRIDALSTRSSPSLKSGCYASTFALPGSGWRRLYPRGFSAKATKEIREQELRALMADSEKMSTLRERLGSISRYMKALDEYIARKANQEDACTGHFKSAPLMIA